MGNKLVIGGARKARGSKDKGLPLAKTAKSYWDALAREHEGE